jgi:quinol monooxygenase YgiN
MDFSIRATLRMKIPARKRREARRILSSMIERIKPEEGCLGCRLYLDAREEGTLLFEEIWSSEKGFQLHLRSDEFRTVLLVVEMATTPPEIRFDRIVHTADIATIADMPGRSDTLPHANRVTNDRTHGGH